MKKINRVMVAFSATSIPDKLAMCALDLAAKNNASLVILSVRDKNIAETVASLTHNYGFLGEKIVEKLKADIKTDRDGIISKRLSGLEKETEKRGISFEMIRVKGLFVEEVVEAAQRYKADALLVEDMGNITDELKKRTPCDVTVIG